MPRLIGSISGLVAKPEYKKTLLVEIAMAAVFRYTDYGFSLTKTIDSVVRTFDPADVVASGIGADLDKGMDDATITIWNVDATWSGVFMGSGARGAIVKVWEGWFDGPSSGAAWVDYVKLFEGRVSDSEVTEDVATLKLLPYITPWTIKVPAETFTPSCSNKFKGARCQYVGAGDTCDRTYEACVAYSNVAHFRGYRFLPDPSKTIFINQGRTELAQREE